MGLELHIAHRDKFELEEPAGGFQLAFPCCVCTHRHGSDKDEPCRTCDHNANAVEEEVCPNCDTALPKGCGGLFRKDGKACWLNKEVPNVQVHRRAVGASGGTKG